MNDFKLKGNKFNYYDTFIKNADIAVEISTILNSHTEEFDSTISIELEEEVHILENEADKNLHETLEFLAKDFLPPIEREDIVLLANRIDDIIDYLDEIAINFNILNIQNVRDDFKDFVQIINKLSILLKEILEKFKDKRNYDKISNVIIDINNIEEEGDRIFEKAIKDLYNNETNPIEVLRWNTIYNILENCCDSYENVANTIGEIILKNT